MWLGYVWSGIANDPEAMSESWSTMCSWQSLGQCSMAIVHDRAEAGSGPSSGSVAWPLKDTTWPTGWLPALDGVSMTGTGAAFATLIVLASVSVPP